MLEVRDAGRDQPIDVGKDRIERFRLLGRRLRQLGTDGTRFHRRHHRSLGDIGTVIGDPVDQPMTFFPKLFGIHLQRSPGMRRMLGESAEGGNAP
jgi:hypothetical protein